jgi:hypothetical protein
MTKTAIAKRQLGSIHAARLQEHTVMSIEKEPQGDPTMTWVYGKVEPGWYIAREIWTEEYARHLKTLGYDVERSVGKPKRKPVNGVTEVHQETPEVKSL